MMVARGNPSSPKVPEGVDSRLVRTSYRSEGWGIIPSHLGHFQVGSYRYTSLIEGLYTF